MDGMPRPRPPHLLHERTRHGKMIWVVRIGHGPRHRIRAVYGTPEFEAEYHAAVRGEPVPQPKKGKPVSGTMRWLWQRYTDSSDWDTLSLATQRQRTNIIKHVLKVSGERPYLEMTREQIVKGRERRKDTPSQANNFLNTMRALFSWAKEGKYVKVDPTDDVKNIQRPDTGGFHPWTEEEIAKFEQRWPVGTRERIAFAVLLYTGFRRGDAVRLGQEHRRTIDANGRKVSVFSLATEKTGKAVTIPVLPELAEILEVGPIGERTFIATVAGKPRVKEGFGTWFREACIAADVPGSAHGLRKAAATRFAERGATVSQLKAWFGWDQDQMASHYTKTADNVRLALALLAPDSIPSPKNMVRDET